MASVSERRIQPIQEAIDAGNFKQALQLCEKWQKKGERSVKFQILRERVFAEQQDAALAKRGRDELVGFCEKNPAITDVDAIRQLQRSLDELKIATDATGNLWSRAVAAQPTNGDLITIWLNQAIDNDDWRTAQKATMALRKSSSTAQPYEMWTVFTFYMIYHDHTIPERERTLAGELAYRLISKAVESTTKEDSPAQPLRSCEELYLFITICLETEHVQEAKEWLFECKSFNQDSSFAATDPNLHAALRLMVLRQSKDWTSMLETLCERLEKKSGAREQLGQILDILFVTVEQSHNVDLLARLKETLDTQVETSANLSWCPNAILRLRRAELQYGRATPVEFLSQCKLHFQSRSGHLSCYEELRNCLRGVDASLQQNLYQKLADVGRDEPRNRSGSNTVTKLNLMKLEYCFVASPNASDNAAKRLAHKAIRLYCEALCASSFDSQVTAQFAVLACMASFRAAETAPGLVNRNNESLLLLKSGFLLRHCMSKCVDDYPTIIVFLHLVILLGGSTLATKLFAKLSIKNVQWESTGHMLLTRLSSLHPRMTQQSDESLEPLQILSAATNANTHSSKSINRHLISGLECGSYVSVVEAARLRTQLRQSFSQKLYDLETCRIRQIRRPDQPQKLSLSSGASFDHRDVSFIPSFENFDVRTFGESLRAGPMPGESWVQSMGTCARLGNMLCQYYCDPQSITSDGLRVLFEHLRAMNKNSAAHPGDCTEAETENCAFQVQVGLLFAHQLGIALSQGEAVNAGDEKEVFTSANLESLGLDVVHWLKTSSAQPLPSQILSPLDRDGSKKATTFSWRFIHSAVERLRSLQIMALFVACQRKKPKSFTSSKSSTQVKSSLPPKLPSLDIFPTDWQETFPRLIAEREKAVRDAVQAFKDRLSSTGAMGLTVDALFGHSLVECGSGEDDPTNFDGLPGSDLESLPGAELMAEIFCAELIESWIETLDGVLSIRVKI